MTPSEFQILTARCDRMQREIDDLRALVGSPVDLGHIAGSTAELSDVLRASVERETTIRETAIIDDTERKVTRQIADSYGREMMEDREPTEDDYAHSVGDDPDIRFLRGLADAMERGNNGDPFQRHIPKRLHEIAAKIERNFRPATPKRATNVKGV